MRLFAIALAGITFTAAHAQNYRYDPSEQQESQSPSSSQSQSSRSAVQELNQAANILGTPVFLREGERAGRIQDVVIDFDTGRVAYMVVQTSPARGQEGNLVAIPAHYFQIRNDELYLNASRSMLQRARTFTAQNLPALPEPRARAYGGYAQSQSQSGQESRFDGNSAQRQSSSSSSGANRNRDFQPPYEYDNYSYDYEYDNRQPGGSISTEKTRTISGTITDINRDQNTITIENWAGHPWTFEIADRYRAQSQSQGQGQSGSASRSPLTRFSEGQEVQINFAYENGRWTAFHIQPEQE